MPIRPENRARYPRDWPTISLRIRTERAGGRCECDGLCGHDHGGRCQARQGEPHPRTGSKVVLTVAHLDHQPENNAEENLRALCQRCHLSHDRDHHQANARGTWARKRRAALNNHELFGDRASPIQDAGDVGFPPVTDDAGAAGGASAPATSPAATLHGAGA